MKQTLLALPLLTLVGCRSGASGYTPVPPPKVEAVSLDLKSAGDLMPLEVGNAWTYAMKVQATQKGKATGGNQGSLTYRVDSKRGDGGALLVLEQDGMVQDRQIWRSSPDGLYQLSGGPNQTPYTPPQPVAPFPLKEGAKFRWSGKGLMANGKVAHGEATSDVAAPQKIDTAMTGADATMSAIPITTNTTFPGGKSVNTTWFKPGVGMVRYRQETTGDDGRNVVILLTLTGYTHKK